MKSPLRQCECGQQLAGPDQHGQQVCGCRRRYRDGELIAWPRGEGPDQCIHRGRPTGDHLDCATCGGGTGQLPIYTCEIFGECTLRKPVRRAGGKVVEMPDCLSCERRQADSQAR